MAGPSSVQKDAATVELRELPRAVTTVQDINNDQRAVDWLRASEPKTHYAWFGLGCLSLATISAIFIAVVLVTTDKKAEIVLSIKSPNATISAINALSNLMLVLGIGQGLAILCTRWELRSIRRQHGNYGLDGGLAPVWYHYASPAAVASLVVKLLIVDAILLPKLSTTYQDQNPQTNIGLDVPQQNTWPITGVVSKPSQFLLGAADAFQQHVVSPWVQSAGEFPQLNQFFKGCDGVCESTFTGLGFIYDCDINRTEANYEQHKTSAEALPVFRTSFEMSNPSTTRAYYDVLFSGMYYQAQSSSGSCAGQTVTYSCHIVPGQFEIDFTVYNDNSSSSTGVVQGFPEQGDSYYQLAWNMYGNQTNGWRLNLPMDHISSAAEAYSKLGGIQLALQQYLGSNANITFDGQNGWILSQDGWLASEQLTSDAASVGSNFGPASPGGCNYNYGDPTLDIVHRINDLALLLNAQALANGDVDANSVQVASIQTTTGPHFSTNYAAMYGVVACMIVCVLMVLPTYYGVGEIFTSTMSLSRIVTTNTQHGGLVSPNINPAFASWDHNDASRSTAIHDGGSSGGGAHRRTTSVIATAR